MNATDMISDVFVRRKIQKERYAVFTYYGGLQTLSQTINHIWGTQILSTKEVLAPRDSFELYDEWFHGYADADTEIDIYVTIQRKQLYRGMDSHI